MPVKTTDQLCRQNSKKTLENLLYKSKDLKALSNGTFTKKGPYGQKITIKINDNNTLTASSASGDNVIIKPDGTIITGKGDSCK